LFFLDRKGQGRWGHNGPVYSSHLRPYPPLLAFIIGHWISDQDDVLKHWPVLGHSTPEELSASQILSCGTYLYMLCGLCDTNYIF